MKQERILKIISFSSLAALIVMMMAATVLEKLYGTPFAFRWVYHHPVFIVLWGVTAGSGLLYVLRRGIARKPFSLGLHIALVLILAGALVTFLFGESGSIHLREGETLSAFELEDGTSSELPFSIRLDEFAIDYHHGSMAPSDYRSAVTFLPENESVLISMNHIAKYRGFRFYQASYDEDGEGSILAVSHDPWGVGITYAGYLLLLVSMIGFFFQRDTAFRAALRRVVSWSAIVALFLVSPALTASAAPASAAQERELKEALGDLYVYYGHRVCPFDTYMQEKGLDASLEALEKMKIFPVADSGGSVSWYSASDRLPMEVLEDDKLFAFVSKSPDLIVESLQEGRDAETLKVLAGIKAYQEKIAASVIPSEGKVKAERAYIRIARPRVQFMLCLGLGLALFILCAVRMSRGRKMPRGILLAGVCIALLLWIYISLAIGLRWAVSGTGPWVGRYSVMMLMAWFATLAIMLLYKKFPLIEPLGFLLAGFTMLLASRESVSPQIMPLMPVLQSPLLSIHVLSMMMSYTLFGLVAFNGVMGQCVDKEASARLQDVSLVVLYPAVFLLTFGTFLGAVWANISWGSYWAWDPKETWALITMLVYSFLLHGGALKAFRRPRFFHLYSILAFIAVLITYFGVNLILGGMHSYA
ncbi:MAG: cytochrome c biogenesis protein CcsA [Bacteroidales bacterium]|nr:cytochrome c biogenesis protein CcsA [Bacteroidales bacterium]